MLLNLPVKTLILIFTYNFFLNWIIIAEGSQVSIEIYTTEAFYLEINKQAFDDSFKPGDDVEFIASIAGMPDLPGWISYRHMNASDRAFLYGTPSIDDDRDIEIEVIALNKYNYDTFRNTLKLEVKTREKIANYEVELKILNLNIEDMFRNDRIKTILQIFDKILWKDSESVYVTKLASPLDVGGRLPLDPNEKEGVIIRIGSTDTYSRDLLDLEREVDRIKNRNPCPKKYKSTSVEYVFRSKGFHIDWCGFKLIKSKYKTKETQSTKKASFISVRFIDEENVIQNYQLEDPFPKRDYTYDVLFCIAIPIIVGTMSISTLICAFFCNQEDVAKPTTSQMEQFNSIERVTSQLRSLGAQNRNYMQTSNNLTFTKALNQQQSSTLPRGSTSLTGRLRRFSANSDVI